MRISNCKLCGVILRNKIRGRPKIFCANCNFAIQKDWNEKYRARRRQHINAIARKYRETHREEVRIQSREWYRQKRGEEKKSTERLLEDIIKNPRKYLRRV